MSGARSGNGLGGLDRQESQDSDYSIELSQGTMNQMLQDIGANALSSDRLVSIVLHVFSGD